MTLSIPAENGFPFLAHTGSRLMAFNHPPGASVAIEGGIFQGDLYAGLVYSPATPTVGSIRIDLVVANPLASGGPAIEVIAGQEDEGAPPDISALPGSAPIAEISVRGNSSTAVVILDEDILDLRPILHVPRSEYRMLFHGRLILGKRMPSVGSQELMGPDVLEILDDDALTDIYPFPKVLTVKATHLKTALKSPSDTTRTWMDLEMPYFVEDFHLTMTPYDTIFRAGSSAGRNGASYKMLRSVSVDSQGRDLPLVRVHAAASGVVQPGLRFDNYKIDRRGSAFIDFQAWGRVS